MGIQLKHYLHAAILVTDLERAEYFYGDVLGLKKVDRIMKFPGAWYQLGDMQIHLIVTETYAGLDIHPEKWGRDRHLAFAVEDIQATRDELLARGYPVQMSNSGRPALFTQDPDSNIIELSQVG
jgi:catechol 2,3-dioxygenase-like lactoylglutathione lyase family enzyme